MATKRLFFALWPDDQVRRQCQAVQRQLANLPGNPVAPANFHATLLFLGHINAAQQSAVQQAAAKLTPQPMVLAFDRLLYWKKPAVICLSSQQGDRHAALLAEQLARSAAECGIATDGKPFHPHITLWRKAKSLEPLEFEPIIFKARQFFLVESLSTPTGVEYRLVKSAQPD